MLSVWPWYWFIRCDCHLEEIVNGMLDNMVLLSKNYQKDDITITFCLSTYISIQRTPKNVWVLKWHNKVTRKPIRIFLLCMFGRCQMPLWVWCEDWWLLYSSFSGFWNSSVFLLWSVRKPMSVMVLITSIMAFWVGWGIWRVTGWRWYSCIPQTDSFPGVEMIDVWRIQLNDEDIGQALSLDVGPRVGCEMSHLTKATFRFSWTCREGQHQVDELQDVWILVCVNGIHKIPGQLLNVLKSTWKDRKKKSKGLRGPSFSQIFVNTTCRLGLLSSLPGINL